jgi:hypothetical protein
MSDYFILYVVTVLGWVIGGWLWKQKLPQTLDQWLEAIACSTVVYFLQMLFLLT